MCIRSLKNLTMILVLLYRFDESQESLLGFQLCQRLVNEGHDLLVTTTSSGHWLEKENLRAKELSESTSGSIRLVQPDCREWEKPSIDWIANLSRQYFGRLYNREDVDMIIGTLPGTSQTAVDLYQAFKDLSLKSELVLLCTTKIQSEDKELKKEFISVANKADEIWSVGPDIYHHYQLILEEQDAQHDCHKEIQLQPQISNVPDIEKETKGHPIRKIMSIWHKPTRFFHKGKTMFSKGSAIDSFASLGAALGKINSESVQQYWWYVYGLQFTDEHIKLIQSQADQNKIKLKGPGKVPAVDDLNWLKPLAFILPDVQEESFNFIALCTIWLGIPTLVSSQSSIGKFLLKLTCPVVERAVVSLTGNPLEDTDRWMKKIKNDILSEDARPMQWAKELSEHIRNNSELWKLNTHTSSQPPSDGLDSTDSEYPSESFQVSCD